MNKREAEALRKAWQYSRDAYEALEGIRPAGGFIADDWKRSELIGILRTQISVLEGATTCPNCGCVYDKNEGRWGEGC